MRQPIVYTSSDKYPVALLIKASAFNRDSIEREYVKELESRGINREDIIVYALEYNEKGKAPVSFIKEQLAEILPALESVGTKFLYCSDAKYFKPLTKSSKAEPHLGYSMKCRIKGYEHMKVVLGINYTSLMYNPANEPKLALSIETLSDIVQNNYQGLGHDIIKSAYYPETLSEIKAALDALHQYPHLTLDLEAFSLDFDKAGIGTVSFCWDQGAGIAFPCDYSLYPDDFIGPKPNGHYGRYIPNPDVRALIKDFLLAYKGRIRYHNSPYDIKILIYVLWMKDLLDTEGLLDGLDALCERFDDTKIITYLAVNSTAGNKLSLKEQAHLFAGNWAQDDIKDIRLIPLPQLLEYNLVDGLATNYVYDTRYPTMIEDEQEDLYLGLMLPSQKMLIQTELTGMPLSKKAVIEAKEKLSEITNQHKSVIFASKIVTKTCEILTQQRWEKDFEDRKAKAVHPEKIQPKPRASYPQAKFNPNSDNQKRVLLYDVMGLPVIDRTKGKQPSTGEDTLKKLVHHATPGSGMQEVIQALIGFGTAEKILTTFIPAFEQALEKGTGDIIWLHGSFVIGGTVSGRLSSKEPNLQNIPSGSVYGKLIKSCFKAPEGKIFCGADFNSLEDYISALTTKDPNKLKVYTDGYDGHCLRAFTYFPEKLPGIVNTVESINSISTMFPDVRQDSKAPTFALTYQGTFITLMRNLGFSEVEAKSIESHYHGLYQVSDEWVQEKLKEASRTGYVTLAFGLRLRTPLLSQTLRGRKGTPFEAEAEGRTAGNALGQSYGLLNNRAMVDFMQKVWKSKYRLRILPTALIHDAGYFVIDDDIDVVTWVNQELIKSMEWQELPEIQHDTVKLGAALDLFYPSWANAITLPNNGEEQDIRKIVTEALDKLAVKERA